MDDIGKPVCQIDAQKQGYRQSKSGIVISFLIHPDDPHEGLMQLALGDVVRLFITKPEIGA